MHAYGLVRKQRALLALLTGVLAVLAVLVLAAPALAQAVTDDVAGDRNQPVVVLNGRADVRTGETPDSVFVLNGAASIDGDVKTSVVVLNGNIVVRGRVGRDAVAVNGRVTLEGGARVDGDVVSSMTPVIAATAHVGGQVRRTPAWQLNVTDLIWIAFLFWLAVTVSLLVFGLAVVGLVPRAVDATIRAGRTDAGWAALWGLILVVGLPIVAVIALATLVGIPLGIGLLLGLVPISVVSFLVSSWILGDVILRKPGRRILAFLIGFAILQGVSLIPYVSSLVWILASIFGTGALAVAVWRARTAPTAMPPAGRPDIGPTTPAAAPPGPPPTGLSPS